MKSSPLGGPQTVWPPPGRQPAHPEKAGRHADRNHAGPASLPARGPHEGRAPERGGNHLADQAQQLRQGAGHRPPGPRHDGWQRHQRRVRRGTPPGEPGSGEHLRRHARCARADSGPRTDDKFPTLGKIIVPLE